MAPGSLSLELQDVDAGSFDEARDYVLGAGLPLVAYVTTSGWFAITTRESFLDRDVGVATLRQLKARALVPADSVLTFGNTYVREVCCR
ncbi:hypothetical protein [Kaistia soli]|uniref:hypothetical protein n=1 Tax=Kaistia soli TaxID=446684 RepID=UPI0009336C1F|nr:hypothetical protein [Kaistia soli]